jgi:hypothetical protein
MCNMTTLFFCKQTSQSLQYFKGKPTDGISCVPVPIDTNYMYKKKLEEKLKTEQK